MAQRIPALKETPASERKKFLNKVKKTLLGKQLFVIFTTPVKDVSEVHRYMDHHIKFQVELEKKGIMFGAGSLVGRDEQRWEDYKGGGMIVIRAKSFEDAERITKEDPFHKHGIRKYEIKRWTLNEGKFKVSLNYSKGTFELE